jgi:hypothetical protein
MKIQITIEASNVDEAEIALEAATHAICVEENREGFGSNDESSYRFEVVHD